MPSHDDRTRRTTEAHRLVEKIARFEQADRTGLYQFGPEERAGHERDLLAARDMFALINNDGDNTVHWDLDEHVRRWIAAHPLALTGMMVKAVIDRGPSKGNGETVGIQIGVPSEGGRYYPLHADQFERDPRTGTLRIVLPDSVAEEFRQQGVRSIQREVASILGVPSLT